MIESVPSSRVSAARSVVMEMRHAALLSVTVRIQQGRLLFSARGQTQRVKVNINNRSSSLKTLRHGNRSFCKIPQILHLLSINKSFSTDIQLLALTMITW